jgi:hypothetical protein
MNMEEAQLDADRRGGAFGLLHLRDRNRILGVQPHSDTPSGRLRWYPLDRRDRIAAQRIASRDGEPVTGTALTGSA